MTKTLFESEPEMKTTALAPWFGSNRMLAPIVGKQLAGCKWVGVPFSGGMSELAHIKASTIVVSDLHRHVINLAMVVADSGRRQELIGRADSQMFDSLPLIAAQEQCRVIESIGTIPSPPGNLNWAVAYFTSCWMGRSAKAGTDDEFNGGLPVRWSATGGDSNTRYRSAIESLDAWGAIMRRCNFVCQDVFEFLDNVKDLDGHGLYLDAPWPDDGDKYKHEFSEAQQRELARRLGEFKNVRAVVRYGDHPLIRKLYPEPLWTWVELIGRTQGNSAKRECLIINGPEFP